MDFSKHFADRVVALLGIIASLALFVLLALLGPLWLAFFSERRLAMSDDYAAIISAGLLALLLLLVVEFHDMLSKAAKEAKESREAYVAGSPKEVGDKILASIDRQVQSVQRRLYAGAFTAFLLVGVLILVALWAAVDKHGPARWLAWLSWMAACWGFVVTLNLGVWKFFNQFWKVPDEYDALSDQLYKERNPGE